ncbi:MAG: ABC transporter permease [Desulfofustis sp.]|nr:ABC transporter permease [Desulfofustis sp.]
MTTADWMSIQIGWRNLWRNPRRTLIILTAIVIGIISMIVMSAFGRGMMEGMVRNSIDNLVGHIKIQNPLYRIDPAVDNRIDTVSEVADQISGLLPEDGRLVKRLRLDGVLSTSRDHVGVMVVGVQPELETGVSFIGRPLYKGTALDPDDTNGLLIGQALLERLGLEIGKKVVLMSQDSASEGRAKAFRIRGSYRTELRDTEKRYVFVNLHTFQDMIGAPDTATEIAVNLDLATTYQTGRIEELVNRINEQLDNENLAANGWRELLPAIAAYIDMFDVYMLIWFVVVFIAMGFGLANTVLMAVYERMREFGLQRALGVRATGIIKSVIIEVVLLLLIGMAVADFSSLFLVEVVFGSGIDLGSFGAGIEMWGISRVVYPVISLKDIFMANGVVILLGLLVGLYPALHAARFTPVETMRHL